jgi:hypothetical protein
MPSIAGWAAQRNLDDVAIFIDEQVIPLEYIEMTQARLKNNEFMAGLQRTI